MDRKQDSLMDSTGLGLLPGVALALFLTMLAIAALLFNSYWALALVVAVVIGAGAAITWVVLALASEDEDEGRMRDAIPGLKQR